MGPPRFVPSSWVRPHEGVRCPEAGGAGASGGHLMTGRPRGAGTAPSSRFRSSVTRGLRELSALPPQVGLISSLDSLRRS